MDREAGVLGSAEFEPISVVGVPKTKALFAVVTGCGILVVVAEDLSLVSSNFLVDGLKNSFFFHTAGQ